MAMGVNQYRIEEPFGNDNDHDALTDVTVVKAMLDEHTRLSSCVKDRIASMPAVEQDLWVGMGSDEVLVSGESLPDIMDMLEQRGMADGTVVVEFLSADPTVLVL